MARTAIHGDQIADGSIRSEDLEDQGVTRDDLNVSLPGKAVVTKVLPGLGIAIDYTGVDEGTGDVTVNLSTSSGGITASQHRVLDQLVHSLAENSFYEIIYSGGRVVSEVWWETSSKEKKIRSIDYEYNGNRVSKSIMRQYDSFGNAISGEVLTENYYYSGSRLSHIVSEIS